MTQMQRMIVVGVAVVCVVASLTALGAQESMSAEGELLRVDASAMTFAIQDADGNEHEFAYTANTEVTGSQGGAAGLATVTGQQVRVEYEPSATPAQPPTAIKIDVRN